MIWPVGLKSVVFFKRSIGACKCVDLQKIRCDLLTALDTKASDLKTDVKF